MAKQALMETRTDIGPNLERVAQVVASASERFPVHSSLTWEEVADSITDHHFRQNGSTWGTLDGNGDFVAD